MTPIAAAVAIGYEAIVYETGGGALALALGIN